MINRIRQAVGKSLGLKILLAAFAVIVGIVTAFTIIAVMRETGRAKAGLQERGRTLSGIFARASVAGVYAENAALLAESAKGITDLPDVAEAAVFTADRRMLYRKGGDRSGAAAWTPLPGDVGTPAGGPARVRELPDVFEFIQAVVLRTAAEADESIYFDVPGAGRERVIGYVRIVLSKTAYRRAIAAMIGQHAVEMAAFLIASVIVTYLRLRRVTRPLEQLTGSVQALGRGLPVEPVPVKTQDEVGNLAAAFNAMAAARAQAEASLRESEDRYRRLVELSPDAIFVQTGGRIVFSNEAGARLLGASAPAEVAGTGFLERVHTEDREVLMRRVLQIEDEGVVVTLLPVRYVHPDGTVVDAEVTAAPFAHQGRNAVLCIARNVTDRKSLEEMVIEYQRELHTAERSLSTLESRVEERERHQIAADLHDHVAQNLALSLFKLGALQKSLPGDVVPTQLEEIRELISQTVQYTRSLTVELSPPVLSEIGLRPALESLAEWITRAHGLPVAVHADGRPEGVGEDARRILFRSVRELLMNAVKHARASGASVTLERGGERLRITVQDDGAGFDPGNIAQNKTGFGLFSIRERLRRLGGSCTVESAAGAGTRVVLEAPAEGTAGTGFSWDID